jgi:hypothetical protein
MIKIYCDHPELHAEFERKLALNEDIDFELRHDDDGLQVFNGNHYEWVFIRKTWEGLKAQHNIRE